MTQVRNTRPPGPRGVPILGMLPAVRRDPTGVFLDAARRFGDVVHFKIGPRNGFLLTNPADVRHVLQDNARNYRKSPLYDKLRLSLGNGLLTSEGEFWLRQRRIAQPAFSRQRVAALGAVMATAVREAAGRWQDVAAAGQSVDVAAEMMRLTRTVVVRALLGGDLGPFSHRIDDAWALMNEQIADSFWSLGLLDRFARAKHRRFEEARAVVRGAVEYAIGERRKRGPEEADLLGMLMSARDEDTGEGMTDEQLRVEVTTFLLAGQETTSLALTWTWCLLSQHPAARMRLEQELDSALAIGRRQSPIPPACRMRGWSSTKPCGCTLRRGASPDRRWPRTSSAAFACRPAGWPSSCPTCSIGSPPTGRRPSRSIPSASRPRPWRHGRSSSISRSAPGRGSASAITSRSWRRT